MLEHILWHPVAAHDQLGTDPLAVTLLGQRVVLWRDALGQPHAWADHCPHRGAQLSLGSLVAGCDAAGHPTRRLACPYHGWEFAPGGRCVHVPAQPDWAPPSSHTVQTHEVQAAHGLLWVRLAPPADSAALPDPLYQPPAFAPTTDPAWRTVLCGPYAVATSAPRLVENFLDMSHFGFVHRGWLGDADHAQVDVGQVQETPHGVVASQCRAWQPRAYASATGGQMVDYRYEVVAPYTALLHKDATHPGGTRNAIALFIQPVQAESCVAWFAMSTQNDDTDDDELRRFQDAVFAQDQPVVESQRPRCLPLGRAARPGSQIAAEVQPPVSAGLSTDWPLPPEVHGPADRLSAAYRRYLARLGVTVGTC